MFFLRLARVAMVALCLPVLWLSTLTGCAETPDDPACLVGTYTVDEFFNQKGPSECSDACDCDGERTCSRSGFCQGTARDCARAGYEWDESTNERGPNLCSNDCECDGARTCGTTGQCEGTSR